MVGPRSGLKTTLLCPLALVGTDHHEAFFSASARSGLKTTLLFDSFAPSPHGRRPLRSLFPLRNSRCGAAATSASSPRAKKKGEHGPGEGQRNAKDHEDAQHVGGVDLLPVHYGPHLSHTHIHTYAHTYKKVERLARTREGGHTTRRCQPAPGTPTPGPVLSLASPLALPLQATRPPTANESWQFLQSPAPTTGREPQGPPARISGFTT